MNKLTFVSLFYTATGGKETTNPEDELRLILRALYQKMPGEIEDVIANLPKESQELFF